jgi:hypothetical protein
MELNAVAFKPRPVVSECAGKQRRRILSGARKGSKTSDQDFYRQGFHARASQEIYSSSRNLYNAPSIISGPVAIPSRLASRNFPVSPLQLDSIANRPARHAAFMSPLIFSNGQSL